MVETVMEIRREEDVESPTKDDGAKQEYKSMFFSSEDLKILEDVFTILSNLKRLDILHRILYSNGYYQLKQLADDMGEKSSSQIALHIRKLHHAGFLAKMGVSKKNRQYGPMCPEVTLIFLRVAILFCRIIKARQIEMELEVLKAGAEETSGRISLSSLGDEITFGFPIEYDIGLKSARESFQSIKRQFMNVINIEVLKHMEEQKEQ